MLKKSMSRGETLLAVEDGLDDVWGEEGEVHDAAGIAIGPTRAAISPNEWHGRWQAPRAMCGRRR